MITIIMAAYNGQEYINEQLESIKNQTYRDWRLVVRDDGSSDKTVDILRKFAEEVEQEVIIKINVVITANIRYAVFLARYIFFLLLIFINLKIVFFFTYTSNPLLINLNLYLYSYL
mgnify:CR=1 FL=1